MDIRTEGQYEGYPNQPPSGDSTLKKCHTEKDNINIKVNFSIHLWKSNDERIYVEYVSQIHQNNV